MQWHKERAKWGGLCPGVARLREGAVRDAPGIILQRRGHVTVGLVEVFPTQGLPSCFLCHARRTSQEPEQSLVM